MSTHRLFLTAALLAGLARPQAATAPGATPSPLSLQDIMSVRAVISPTVSPDGQAVLFAQQEWELAEGNPARPARRELRTRVWVVPTVGSGAGLGAKAVSAPDRSATSPAWSPDSRFISFISAGGSGAGRPQVWIMPAGGGDARQLTESDGVTSAVWASDAKRIAFTSRERPTKAEEDRRARGDDATVFEEDLRRTYVWVVDVGTGVTSRVTTGDGLSVKGQATWAPDSVRLAFVAAPTPMQRDHRDAVYVADLARHTIDRILAGEAARRTPAWSPDGRTIAFAGQPLSTDALGDGIPSQGVGLFHLMLYDVSGKRLSDVSSPSFDRNVGNPVWTPDSRRILFSTEDRVYQNVFAYDLASGQFSRLTTTKNITLGDVNRDGTLAAFTAESASSTAEVFVSDLRFASPRQLTIANPQLADRALGQTEVVSWKSGDGLDVEGLLLKPVGYVEGRRYPLLVVVHGGPASRTSFTAR